MVDAAASVASGHVTWDGIDPINPSQEEACWLLQQPTIDQSLGSPAPKGAVAGGIMRRPSAGCTSPIASIGPSCGLALWREGKLLVWTHSQGVYPLRRGIGPHTKA